MRFPPKLLHSTKNVACLIVSSMNATTSTNLRDVLSNLISKEQSRIKNFKTQYGKTNIGSISVDMVRIRSHGYSIPECQQLLPKVPGRAEPLPEGLFWLLVTGQVPTEEQVSRRHVHRAYAPVPHHSQVSFIENATSFIMM
uniref:Citrate synthase n=1 Tax=Hucho hucho TaxID=62062 RepID=A0A4W5NVT4_9TELE